jgi:hypothetical protein
LGTGSHDGRRGCVSLWSQEKSGQTDPSLALGTISPSAIYVRSL